MVFLVDITKIPLKDLNADDCGAWESSCPRRCYRVKTEKEKVISVSQVSPETNCEDVYILKRSYGTHKATKEQKGVTFQRIIATAKRKYAGTPIRRAIMQYTFRDSEEVPLAFGVMITSFM